VVDQVAAPEVVRDWEAQAVPVPELVEESAALVVGRALAEALESAEESAAQVALVVGVLESAEESAGESAVQGVLAAEAQAERAKLHPENG
jgi:hypothetical protein